MTNSVVNIDEPAQRASSRGTRFASQAGRIGHGAETYPVRSGDILSALADGADTAQLMSANTFHIWRRDDAPLDDWAGEDTGDQS